MFTECISQTLETVDQVDLNKYAGTWYEIAAFPQRFQKDVTPQQLLIRKPIKVILSWKTDAVKTVSMGKNLLLKEKLLLSQTPGMPN